MKADLAARDPSLAAVFAAHPGFRLVEAPPFRFPQAAAGDTPSAEQLIAATALILTVPERWKRHRIR
jgi:hypothetical protein